MVVWLKTYDLLGPVENCYCWQDCVQHPRGKKYENVQISGRRGFAEILPEDDQEREVRASSRSGVREMAWVSQSEGHMNRILLYWLPYSTDQLWELQVVHSRAQLICGAGSGNNFSSTAAISSGDSRAGSGGMEPGLLALQMAEAC